LLRRPSDRKAEAGSNSSMPPERPSGKPKVPVPPTYLDFVSRQAPGSRGKRNISTPA
jgi:hypothetical protein